MNINEYLKQRSKKLLREMTDLLGGKCVDCETTKNLQFDHNDRRTKEFEISKARSVSRERLLREVKKCSLRCTKCHLEKGRKAGDVLPAATHGSYTMYARNGCRCDLCKEGHNAKIRRYRYKSGLRKPGRGPGRPRKQSE